MFILTLTELTLLRQETGALLKLILPYFKNNLYKILFGLFCMIVVDGAQILIPQIIKSAVDTLTLNEMSESILVTQSLSILGLGTIMAILRYGWRIMLMGSARDVEKGIRDHLFSHVLSLDMAYHDRVKTGDIMAHATSDINHIRMAFGFGLIVLVDIILLGGATLGIMIWTHPKLTAFAMMPMPFMIYYTKYLGQKMHVFHKTAQESFSMLTEQIRESFFGIRVIKVFNFEAIAEQKLEHAARDYFAKNLKRAVVTALLKPLLVLFLNLSTLIMIFYGGFLVMEKNLTPGELVAFLQYLGLLAWPAIAIGWMINIYQRGMASLNRINTLLESKPDVSVPAHPILPADLKGRLTFEGACFSYPTAPEKSILSDISMDLSTGMSVGISGPPGSGKTSLVQLIPRLYNLTQGRLLLDNRDVADFDPDALRKEICFMPQEPFLFSGTIRENILMGRDIDLGHLTQTLKTCDLETTIKKIPDGLDTLVGERGVTLSGGQKQRVALARTLIVPSPILILDDPISQLDTHTAQNVIKQINQITVGSTKIIISHRLSALAACDEIYILKNGRIHNRGTHEELIEIDRFYKDSFRVQQFEEEISR